MNNEHRYNWLLNNRTNVRILSSKGIHSTDMADSMLARMGNGATWNDALYSARPTGATDRDIELLQMYGNDGLMRVRFHGVMDRLGI